MPIPRLVAIVASCASLGLAGCLGGDDDSTATAPATTTEAAPSAPAATGTEIKVQNSSEYGKVLADGEGLALYLFDKEKTETSECYGECAVAWPPVLTEGKPKAGSGVDAGALGTTKRDDGSTQVTYKGKPMYLYKDDKPGVILCHDVSEFGGLWLLVQPNGKPVPGNS
jgi:predicted lipoprotein with Yx(FWY)xxD motif